MKSAEVVVAVTATFRVQRLLDWIFVNLRKFVLDVSFVLREQQLGAALKAALAFLYFGTADRA